MVVTGHSFLKRSTKAAKCTSPEGQLLGWQRFELSLRHTFLPKKALEDFGGGFHLELAQSWPRPMEWFYSQNINSYRARKLKTANSKCLRRPEHAKQSIIHVTWIRLLLIYHVQNHTVLLKGCPTAPFEIVNSTRKDKILLRSMRMRIFPALFHPSQVVLWLLQLLLKGLTLLGPSDVRWTTKVDGMIYNVDKFKRTSIYGLPMHASASPGHKFHFTFFFKFSISASILHLFPWYFKLGLLYEF